MTAQIKDKISISGQTYTIDRCSDRSQLFDPRAQGISLSEHSFSTACNQGFYCEYIVSDNRLLLRELNFYPSYAEYLKFKYGRSEALFYGKSPKSSPSSRLSGMWQYQDLYYPIDYNGGLVICTGYTRRDIILSNTNPPFFLYENVYEAIFDAGILIDIVDYSLQVKQVRERVISERAETNDESSYFSIYDIDRQILTKYFRCNY